MIFSKIGTNKKGIFTNKFIKMLRKKLAGKLPSHEKWPSKSKLAKQLPK